MEQRQKKILIADDFITKPFDLADLQETSERYL